MARRPVSTSIRRGKADVKDIKIVAIPTWSERMTRMNLFETTLIPTNRLFEEWASATKSVRWIKPGTKESVPWHVKPDGKYWRGEIEGMKLDLFLVRPENWGFQFLLRPGCADFSAAVLGRAKYLGLPSRDGFLTRGGAIVPVREEGEVFELLGIEWIEPSDRNDTRAVRLRRR